MKGQLLGTQNFVGADNKKFMYNIEIHEASIYSGAEKLVTSESGKRHLFQLKERHLNTERYFKLSVSNVGTYSSHVASSGGDGWHAPMAIDDIGNGDATTITYVDAGVGTVGLGATALGWAGYAVPGVGWAAGVYGIMRTSFELGKAYGPSKWYGTNDNKWFE